MGNDSGTNARTLYGIGLGPGDPGLITVKARAVLNEAAIVFVPKASGQNESLARRILETLDLETERWTEGDFPMPRDREALSIRWAEIAEEIAGDLQSRGNGAFVTIGDPSVYSTWIYLSRAITQTRPEVSCETIPGIQTMNAAAAALGIPLVEGDERLALTGLPEDEEDIKDLISRFDTVVFYKVARNFPKLLAVIDEQGLGSSSYYARRVGLPEEVLALGIESIPKDADGYMSAVIVKGGRKR